MKMAELDLKSIDDLADEDYVCHSGWHNDIYLDPGTGKVYTFYTDNAVPISAYNGIDQRIYRVHRDAVPTSVRDNILSMGEWLSDMLESFVGTEWDGSNHIGVWKESTDDLHWREPFDRHFEEHIQIKYYSDPDEWFTDQDLKKLWRDGETPPGVLDKSCLDNGDSCCKESDALAYLQAKWDEWQAEEDALPSEPDDFTYNDH
jgi:hypothetical protein